MKKAYKVFKSYRPLIDELDSIEPESIPSLFGLVDSLEIEQLMALTASVKTDRWMDNPLVFEDLILILNGVSPNIYEFEGCSTDQLWYGLYILAKFRPDIEFGELVRGYIEFTSSNEGFYIYPKESGMKSPIKETIPEIIRKIDNDTFDESSVLDNQASKLYLIMEYIKEKIKKDELY